MKKTYKKRMRGGEREAEEVKSKIEMDVGGKSKAVLCS